jgi:hypothetical protein
MIGLGVVVYALSSSLSLEDYAMTCTSGLGCVSRDPVLFTVHGATLKHVEPLLTAGAVLAASALAVAALRPRLRRSIEARSPVMRFTVALWIVAGVLVVGGSAFAFWSNTPDVVNSTIQECTVGIGCVQTVVYTLQQLSFTVVPAALTAGLLTLGLAIAVTSLRRGDGGEPDAEADAPESVTWGGSDLTPFMPPTDRP